MTLSQFSSDVMPIVSGIIAMIGLYFIWHQIRVATSAMERTSNWNKIHATYTYFDLERNTKFERQLYESGQKIGVNFLKTLTTDELQRIVDDKDTFVYAKEFLNDFEYLCAAYQTGFLDRELTFHLHGTRVVKEYNVLFPFIVWLRQNFNDDGILIEIQKTAKEWQGKLEIERHEQEQFREQVGANPKKAL